MAENKCCYNCSHYKPYYVKGYKQFDRLDFGMCGKTKETQKKHFACEKFAFKCYGRVSRKQMALATLTENINVLAEIKQILEDEDEEDLEELVAIIRERRRKGI